MIDIENIGVPKGEGTKNLDTPITLIESKAIEEVIELLEDSMKHGETHLSHDEVRLSGHIMATNVKTAYKTLIEAHPDYELEENE
jgi:uncharacterized protein (UPF0371 family)